MGKANVPLANRLLSPSSRVKPMGIFVSVDIASAGTGAARREGPENSEKRCKTRQTHPFELVSLSQRRF